jgi:hypothetical protein
LCHQTSDVTMPSNRGCHQTGDAIKQGMPSNRGCHQTSDVTKPGIGNISLPLYNG